MGGIFCWSSASDAAWAAMSPPKPSPTAGHRPEPEEGGTRAVVLAINLDSAGDFGRQLNRYPYNRTFRAIAAKADILSATTARQAMDLLRGGTCVGGGAFPPLQPEAIYIPDPLIAKEENRELAELIVQCCARDGATVIIGSLFPSEIEPAALDAYLERVWRLPWRAGDLIGTDVFMNNSATHLPPIFSARDKAEKLAAKNSKNGSTVSRPTTTDSYYDYKPDRHAWKRGLQSELSHRALFLRGVPHGARWFVTTEESVVTSRGQLPFWEENRLGGEGLGRVVQDQTQTPVAFMRYGEGCVGYTGDVCGEYETEGIVMSMLGLN